MGKKILNEINYLNGTPWVTCRKIGPEAYFIKLILDEFGNNVIHLLVPSGPTCAKTRGSNVVIAQLFPSISFTLRSSALSLANERSPEHLLKMAVVMDNVLFLAWCSAIALAVCWRLPSCGLLKISIYKFRKNITIQNIKWKFYKF